MTNKRGPNDVNEELPDEHEVIQHSLRESSDKPQPDKAPVKKNKPDNSRFDDSGTSPGREANKRR